MRRLALRGVLLVLVAIIGLLITRFQDARDGTAASPEAGAELRGRQTGAGRGEERGGPSSARDPDAAETRAGASAARRPDAAAPPARTAIPRPANTMSDKRERPAGARPPDADEAARAERLRRELMDRADEVGEDISACIEAWSSTEPDIEGRVVVRFAVDVNGLQDAWIEEHDGVPGGPLTCFSAAVWTVDWSGIADEPLEVTYPFEVSPDQP